MRPRYKCLLSTRIQGMRGRLDRSSFTMLVVNGTCTYVYAGGKKWARGYKGVEVSGWDGP